MNDSTCVLYLLYLCHAAEQHLPVQCWRKRKTIFLLEVQEKKNGSGGGSIAFGVPGLTHCIWIETLFKTQFTDLAKNILLFKCVVLAT